MESRRSTSGEGNSPRFRGWTCSSSTESPGFAARTLAEKAPYRRRKQRIASLGTPLFMSTRLRRSVCMRERRVEYVRRSDALHERVGGGMIIMGAFRP